MLLCKRTCCLWYLVYIDCSSTTRRPSGRPQERDHRHGQDCCNRICPQHAAARPPLRCDRSRADGLGPHLAAQRRPAPLRPLRTSVPTLLQASIKFPPRLVAPVRRGPFFCPQFARAHFVLRQIRRSDRMARLDGLPAGIPHTNLATSLLHQRGARCRDGRCNSLSTVWPFGGIARLGRVPHGSPIIPKTRMPHALRFRTTRVRESACAGGAISAEDEKD